MKEPHVKVWDILSRESRKGLLLDVAGGDGKFAEKLKALGYSTVSCDLFASPNVDTPFVRADMNDFLPFRTGVFQAITCIGSLQYMENPRRLFREFARLLGDGGELVLTVPNILGCGSRLFFLHAGYFKHFKPFKSVKSGREWDSIVYAPISFVEIFQHLTINGITIETVTASKYRYLEWPLYVLYRMFYRLLARKADNQMKKKLLDFLFSKEILLGDHLVVIARKKL
ncbi:MAG: class I SAM-dependent methyltransferase [Geobacter sp.]|nr:class I SAM-dependent methyltransferase [Geobacter sp.]